MQKHIRHLTFLALLCAVLSVTAYTATAYAAEKEPDLIRFHVIANSDSTFDQSVKLKVRDAVIKETEALLENAENTREAEDILTTYQAQIIQTANDILRQYHCDYRATADLGTRTFPAKAYGNRIFPAGKYNAFRIILGDGAGKNWWCVLYPPLCFVDIKDDTAVAVTTTTNISADATDDTFAVNGDLFQIKLRFKLLDEISSHFPTSP